ncbi:hypothetical protein [Ruegeria halocynthiae]|uniref:hypothetical protein n=1 Tax=Ruegeria halocynthiae TaxID=985054 RepID=UPI00055DFF10|nr:hypothetical protein [Ruegeria halocynthiae]
MTTRGTFLAITLLVFGWVGILIGVTLLSDDAPAALVLFPGQDFLVDIPEDVAVLAATPFSVTLASDDADLAFQLYQHGAWLVLPAGLQGCASRL